MIPVNKSSLDWVAKNKITFIIVILVAGNVFQYIQHTKYENELRTSMQTFYEKSVQYERDRSEKLEHLLTKTLNFQISDSTK